MKRIPYGYVLYRQLVALERDCIVVAPSVMPAKTGDWVKCELRDAVILAKLPRAGELVTVWV
ncbi:IS110 family transposase, partial [Glutamicibacter soli]|nr:IS110 family transposase [Glutamicibacter soli]